MTEQEYFETIESFFLQKRGDPHLLTPKEWSLIHDWFDAQIPCEIVLRAIEGGYEKKKDKEDVRLTLTYFRRIVKAEHKRYLKSLEGTTSGDSSVPEAKNVGEFLQRLSGALEASSLQARDGGNQALADLLIEKRKTLSQILETFNQNGSSDLQRVENQLTTLEKEIEQLLLQTIPEQQMQAWKEEAMRELKTFEHKVEIPIYVEMVNRAVTKSIRKLYNIPRLSIFYM